MLYTMNLSPYLAVNRHTKHHEKMSLVANLRNDILLLEKKKDLRPLQEFGQRSIHNLVVWAPHIE